MIMVQIHLRMITMISTVVVIDIDFDSGCD
jgi:hypothetical protein